MAKVLGINALVYVVPLSYSGGLSPTYALPNRNNWSITITRELQEARVFTDAAASASWVEQIAGFRSWNGSVNGYFDTTATNNNRTTDLAIGVESVREGYVWLYEDREFTTSYWYGAAWFELNEDVSTDSVVELNIDFTGTGPLLRFHTDA